MEETVVGKGNNKKSLRREAFGEIARRSRSLLERKHGEEFVVGDEAG